MAERGELIVGLDLGATKVSAIVGEVKEGGIDIVGIGCHPSQGLKEGAIVNLEGMARSIKGAVEDAEIMAGCRISSVYAGISGSYIKSFNSHGAIGVKDGEISQKDINEVMEAAKAVAIPQDQEVLHVLPQEFIVDGQEGIQEPLGMNAVRLEARVHVVTAATRAAQNIIKCANKAGLEVKEVIFQQLASAEAVTTKEERDVGVVVLDIGGDTTKLALFHRGAIRHSAVLPLGGNHITSDISIGLRTPAQDAEGIKKKFGCALASLVDRGETFEVSSLGDRKTRLVSRQLLAEIIEARAQEILEMAQKEISPLGYERLLAGGVVITGGTSILRGMTELAEMVFGLPARLGLPAGIGGLVDQVLSPIYATGMGLVLYAYSNSHRKKRLARGKRGFGLIGRMKDWLAQI